MFSYTIMLLIVAIVAGALGFVAVAGATATVAKICCVLFLVLFVLSLFRGNARRP